MSSHAGQARHLATCVLDEMLVYECSCKQSHVADIPEGRRIGGTSMKLTAPCGALVRLKLETKPLTRAERFELESELDDLRRQRLREEAEDRAARQARERGSGNYRY